MFHRIKKTLDRLGAPELDWIQVEVTTCCDASCIYCPQQTLGRGMPRHHMPRELFLKLIPFIGFTKMIYLQGWGEPLLQPDLFEMIRICKSHGKYVGFTTNGMGLNERTIHRIIDSGPDIMGVSLAGVTPSTHNRFREGNDFDTLINNLRRFKRIKVERNSALPALHLAFLMVKSNFKEMMRLVPLAKELGATQVVASNLSLILTKDLSKEAVFNDTENIDAYCNDLARLKTSADHEGILFAYSRPRLDENAVDCSENVGHACVVTVDGDVTPCVFTNPVLTGEGTREPVYYCFKDQVLPLVDISFGNIQDEHFTRIWHKNAYARFRDRFDANHLPAACKMQSELPDPCRYCYKRLMEYL